MKVLLLNNSLANGGLERQLVVLARGLPPGWERRLWSIEGGPHAEAVLAAGVPLRVQPRRARYDVSPAFDLWRQIHAWRPDVVHSWHWMTAAAAVPACRALNIPLIDGSIRMGSVPRELGRPRRSIMRFAAAVVANSRAGLAAWRVDPAKGRVIYNAFDDSRLKTVSAGASQGGGSSRRFTVVMAARMDPPKDFATVIDAARLLAGRDPRGWRFLLVGDGCDRGRLLAATGDLADSGVIEFPEAGIEIMQHVRAAQVGLLVTDPAILAEGCSNSIMEYMACELPVVCSDSGGNRELVSDGVTGYVVRPRDAVALAARLEELRSNAALRRRLGTAGRERVEREFTVERMVAEYIGVYRDVLARRRSR
jgi:glycosyltransferase involved in cell wall biosynthesis